MKNQGNKQSMPENTKIDAIKDLLFGDNLQQYEAKFDALEEGIKALRAEFNQKIEVLSTELVKSIQQVEISNQKNLEHANKSQKNVDKQLEAIEAKIIQNNKKLLSETLISIGESLK